MTNKAVAARTRIDLIDLSPSSIVWGQYFAVRISGRGTAGRAAPNIKLARRQQSTPKGGPASICRICAVEPVV
jgi:hypothetical protein